MKKQPEQMPEDQRFHDTYLLLKKYRDVVWGLELSVQQVKRRFQMEVGSSIEDFLESIYLAGVDFSDNGIEEQARSIEKSYQMLKLLEVSVNIMRNKHLAVLLIEFLRSTSQDAISQDRIVIIQIRDIIID